MFKPKETQYDFYIQRGHKYKTEHDIINDVIDISGGKNPLTGKINLIRYDKDGAIQKKFIPYRKDASRGSSNNPYLKDGDILVINKGKLKNTNIVVKTVTEPLTNILSTYIFLKNVSDL